MRLKNILISIGLLSIFHVNNSFSATPSGHELRFKIKGLKDSLCYLANYYGEKQYLQDSSKADANGNVVFKGKESLPGGIYLFVFPNKTYFELLVDKYQNFSMECESDDIITSMVVKGSDDNVLFYKYLNFIQEKSKQVEPLKTERKKQADLKNPTDSLDVKIRAIDEEVTSYKTTLIAQHPGSFLADVFKASEEVEVPPAPMLPSGVKDSTFSYRFYKEHYFDFINLSDDRLLRTPIYHSKVSGYMKNMVIQMPDSLIKEADMLVAKAKNNPETYKYMIWYMTNTYETSNIMGLDEVFVHMVKKYYTKEIATWADEATLYKIQDRANVLDPILIGKTAKNLILADTNGVYQALYNVKSPITILYFWDPDCGHCKKTTPLVKTYYDKVKSKGVSVFAVNSAVEEEKWKSYIRENKLEWINVADLHTQNNFRHEFDVSTTPQIFILDKDKKIIAKKIDEETMEKIVDNELEKKANNPK